MLPSVTSKNLGIRFTRVVLPLPVEPIKAVVSPGFAVNDISDKTASSASAYLKLTFLNSTIPRFSLISCVFSLSVIDISFLSISPTLPIDTAALGRNMNIMAMNRNDIIICIAYCINASILPISRFPASI